MYMQVKESLFKSFINLVICIFRQRFKVFLSRKVSSLGGCIFNASGQLVQDQPILMNGGILKSQKLLAELTIKLHMSNQQQKSEINCPMNVVSYAQIAFKKRIFQARPADAES